MSEMETYKIIISYVVLLSFLLQSAYGDDCLTPISRGSYKLLMINPKIFCVNHCHDILKYVGGYSHYPVGTCYDNSTCIVEKEKYMETFPLLDNWLREQSKYEFPMEFTKIEPAIVIAIGFERRDTIFDSLLENANFFKGYYLDEDKDLVFAWKADFKNFLTFYEANATKSAFNNNSDQQYITFEGKHNFTLSLGYQVLDGLWATNQPSLFVTNTNSRYVSDDWDDVLKAPGFSQKVLQTKPIKFCEKQEISTEEPPEDPEQTKAFKFILQETPAGTTNKKARSFGV